MLRGLKTLTTINLFLLMLFAMALIDFVLIIILQKSHVSAEADRASMMVRALSYSLGDFIPETETGPFTERKKKLNQMLLEAGFSCALIIHHRHPPIFLNERFCPSAQELTTVTETAMKSGEKTIRFFGETWGVFWKQPQSMIVSEPLFRNELLIGSVGVVFPLEKTYQALRNSQKSIIIYILINAAILSFVGLYRIAKIYFEPVRRLAKRAEEYTEEEIPFSVRKEDNELNQLSKSLNTMVKRISDDKGKLKSIIASLEKANEELKMAHREVIRAEKLASVGRLASGIAHEIGNPLGIVGGYLELLGKQNISPEEREEFTLRASSEVGRINVVIRQLLDFSRPSKGTLSICSANEVVRNIVDMLAVQPFMSHITIEPELLAKNDAVCADPDQLRQVFVNLSINAADAIASKKDASGGKIIVKTENEIIKRTEKETVPNIKISVIDNGAGIAEELIDTIFDPFFTTKDPGKGTGLGLWVSFMIVDGIGGKMKANSRVGKGTVMEVILPLHEESRGRK